MWGATVSRMYLDGIYYNFNPRTHVGCDMDFRGSERSNRNFNPRTHVGCDNSSGSTVYNQLDFNPRTHVGCDEITSKGNSLLLEPLHLQ